MAFGGGARRGRPRSDINVTPLVDIVLVMLITFLVTMPLVIRNVTLELPSEAPPDRKVAPSATLTVEVTGEGLILVDGKATARDELVDRLRERLETEREKVVFVDFADPTRYGEAVSIMSLAGHAGPDVKVAMKMRAPAP